jgi:adenylylsulfate kinase-like enzyme
MRLAEGLVARGWTIDAADRDQVRAALPSQFGLDAEGRVKRR